MNRAVCVSRLPVFLSAPSGSKTPFLFGLVKRYPVQENRLRPGGKFLRGVLSCHREVFCGLDALSISPSLVESTKTNHGRYSLRHGFSFPMASNLPPDFPRKAVSFGPSVTF